jgi:hypothetical protein
VQCSEAYQISSVAATCHLAFLIRLDSLAWPIAYSVLVSCKPISSQGYKLEMLQAQPACFSRVPGRLVDTTATERTKERSHHRLWQIDIVISPDMCSIRMVGAHLPLQEGPAGLAL